MQVRDETGAPVANVNVRIAQGNGDADSAIFDVQTDESGNQTWPVPFWPATKPYTLHVNYRRVLSGYGQTSVFVQTGDDVPIVLPRVSALSPLVQVDRHRFVTAGGARVFLKGCSDFLLFYRHLRGEDIRPLLGERQALGFNAVRVFGMCHYVPVNEGIGPTFRPQDYGDRYYDEVPRLTDLCAQYGLYVYFSAFPDNGLIMPTLGDQQAHHARLRGVFRGLYELTNEVDAHDFNYVDAAQFGRPTEFLSCAGSAGEGVHPYVWDFFDFHPRRDYPSHIKDCNLADNPNAQQGHEGLLGEPDRYGWSGNTNARQAFESAGSSKGTALGFVFHSKRGLRSEPFDDQTRDCARACLEAIGDQ